MLRNKGVGGTRFVTMRYKGWGGQKGEFWCYILIIEWPYRLVIKLECCENTFL